MAGGVSAGLAAGYDDGTLGPKDFITREQMAMFMMNFCNAYIDDKDLVVM